MTQPSSHDLELLSAYLDGQLSKMDTARLESRIKSDPELRSIYDGLRQTRALLRQLPSRRAPRNFRLTPQMVGKPALPRSFPIFRLASVLATLLLFLGYAVNLVASANPMAAATSFPYDTYAAEATAPAEMPATEEAATATSELPQGAAPKFAPTATPEVTAFSQQDTTTPENRSMAAASNQNSTLVVPPAPPLPINPGWLFGLLGMAVFSGVTAFFVRLRAQPRKLTAKDFVLIALTLAIVIALATGIYWMSLR